jgi:hypothetical protein
VTTPSGTSQDLRGIWAIPGTAWAAGAQGTLLIWDGGTWSAGVQGLAPYDFQGVWGASADQVWAVASGGVILFWNGSAWAGVPGMPFQVDFKAVSGTGASDVWAVGQDTSGGQFAAVAYHWDGGSWTESTPTHSEVIPFTGVAASASQVVAMTPGLLAFDWTGLYWAQGEPPLPGPNTLTGGAAVSTQIWATTTDGGVAEFVGGTVNVLATGVTADLLSISVVPNSDVWAVGDQGAIVHASDGGGWQSFSKLTATTLNGVWAVPGAGAASEVWAVGDQGVILHYTR